ncbi:MAG: DEAD/DEAH box helicase [Phycisphaerales bacterium]|nr:DEAD/DEAH box helicase [Phycisphaerales bacterium]
MADLSASAMLGDGGAIARAMGDGFESRPQQLEMAGAIARALDARSTLLVEAGTGVGKSFAYLVPTIARIIEKQERVVIATNTIALQEQLLEKDIPVMRRVFAEATGQDDPFKAELVKGRGNYMSVRRLALASAKQQSLVPDAADRRSLHTIEDWAYSTKDGTLSTLPQLERPTVWDLVQSDASNCMGRKCKNYEVCFYQQARRRMQRADLLICNHAVFFSDLAMRAADRGFLPDYQHVILDEAHNIEDVAGDHFGLLLSEGRVRFLLSRLFSTRSRGAPKGFLATLRMAAGESGAHERCIARVVAAVRATDHFFEQVCDRALARDGSPGLAGTDAGTTRRLREPRMIENVLTEPFGALALALKQLRDTLTNDEDRHELNSYAERAAAIADEAEALCEQQLEGCVYWAEANRSRHRVRASLACCPIDVAPILEDQLFGQPFSVVLTSATLSLKGAGTETIDTQEGADSATGFGYMIGRLGCDGARAMALGSPFDYAQAVELFIEADLPEPASPEFNKAANDRMLQHVDATDGGAFVLFTSFASMYRAADALAQALETRGHPLWVQGRDGSRSAILDGFRTNERAVLFGTTSFWQGVDVRGRGLRNVVITKLPFDPPDRPVVEARMELIKERGGNPFMQESVPRAVMRFKQGFGRLIRSTTDHGRVVVLDKRIVTTRYGRLFLDVLPEGVRALVAR